MATHLATHPADASHYLVDRFASDSPLDRGVPWFSWSAIRRLDAMLRPGIRVFEWGVGGSTRFLLEHGCEVTTVETSAQWAEIARQKVPVDVQPRLTLRVIDPPEPARAADDLGALVSEGAPWDIVMVDGPADSRMRCLEAAREAIIHDGVVILDDAWRHEYDEAPEIMSGFERVRCVGNGPCRPGVTRTDFYQRAVHR